MRQIKYEILDDNLSLKKRPAAVRFFRDLLWPKERSPLALFDFGIVCGAIWALLVALFTLMAAHGKALLLAGYFESIYPGYTLATPSTLSDLIANLGIGMFFGFVHGCLFGFLAGFFYNRLCPPALSDVNFKTKIFPEGKPFLLVESGNRQKLPEDPYTIFIIANPILEYHADPAIFKIDPILSEPKLFQAKVATIINSLAQSSVVRPFLPKMRLVALFDPALGTYPGIDLAHFLAEEARGGGDHTNGDDKKRQEIIKEIESRALGLEDDIDITVEPLQRRLHSRFKENEDRINNFLQRYQKEVARVDIVFVVTASHTHTRSSSLYTIDKEEGKADRFTIRYQPKGATMTGFYWPRAEIPGMVAYSAWDFRLKTPVHEFAHAMSSTEHGLIVDEYDDLLPVDPKERLVINKRLATPDMDKNRDQIIQLSELPMLFVEYTDNGKTRRFMTDRRRETPAQWLTFVPERSELEVPCTMDLTDDDFEFDRLIQHFMTRRLTAKVGKIE